MLIPNIIHSELGRDLVSISCSKYSLHYLKTAVMYLFSFPSGVKNVKEKNELQNTFYERFYLLTVSSILAFHTFESSLMVLSSVQ